MKWAKRILFSLLLIVLLALTVLYAWSSVIINQEFTAIQRNILPSSRPEILVEGERLAKLYGCYEGCHGKDMEGRVFFEQFAVGKFIAPNLTTANDKYSRSEMEAIIRQGILPNGKSVIAMPSASFATMTDIELSAILSFIAAYPKQDNDAGKSSYGIMARLMLVLGEHKPAAIEVSGEPMQSSDLDTPLALGEYLALNTCSECHGLQFEGQDGFTPPLDIAKGYPMEDFRKLMATGTGLGDRDLGLMTEVALKRFKVLKPEEVEALHQFLVSR